MKIAIDVDGVLAEQVPLALDRLRNQGHRVSKTKEDIQRWDEPLPEAGTDIERAIVESLEDPEFVLGMEPVEGAVSGVQTLHEAGHELIVITHRPETSLEATEEWLSKHKLLEYIDEIHGVAGPKVEGRAEVLIDDNPGNIYDFVYHGGHGIMFRQPWNRSSTDQVSDNQRMLVADTWAAVVEIIQELSSTKEVNS